MLSSLWFLVPALPISIWVSWSDLKFMKIPNKASIALLVGFLILGPFILSLPEFGWRLVQGFVVLVVGFLLNAGGLIGGGDAKFAAALAPFVAFQDSALFLFILAAMSISALLLHRIVGRISALKSHFQGWLSWEEHGDFPMGLALAGALLYYLVFHG